MKRFVFATKINNTDQSGVVDIKKMELMCICDQPQGERIAHALQNTEGS